MIINVKNDHGDASMSYGDNKCGYSNWRDKKGCDSGREATGMVMYMVFGIFTGYRPCDLTNENSCHVI